MIKFKPKIKYIYKKKTKKKNKKKKQKKKVTDQVNLVLKN